MAENYMRFSEATEATDAQMTDAGLVAVSVVDQSSASGYSTKRSPLSRLGNYILNKYAALQLGGVARTVKAAIDAIATSVTNLTTLIGSSAMGTDATTVTGAIAEHEGDISMLSSKTAPEAVSITAISPFQLGANNSFRIGNLVVLSFKIVSVNSTADTTTVIGETSVLPPVEVNILFSTNTNAHCHGWIRTNGEIVLYSTGTSLTGREVRAYSIYTVSN